MPNRHQLILHKLIQARLGNEWVYAVPERNERLETGWLPLHALQGAECGGSAANVRLHELRSPEGTLNGKAHGIPVEHKIFSFAVGDKTRHIYAYRLALEIDQLVFIDRNQCRMNKSLLSERGYEIHETNEQIGGGRAVRIRKKQPTRIGQTVSLFG